MPTDSHPHHARSRARWIALLVTVLWSSSWVLVRIGLDDEELPPITFAGLRYALAAAVLVMWIASRPAPRRELTSTARSAWRPLLVLGVVFYAVTQGAQFVAIDSQPAATSSLMLAPTALLVAASSQLAIGESVRPRQFAGALLLVIGATVYFAGDLGATAIGMAASTIGLVSNVGGSLLGRSINRSRLASPVVVTAVSMTIGAAVLLTTGLVVQGLPRLSPTAIAVIAWLAVVNTAVAFTLWNASLRHLAAIESAAINNTMLVQISLLGWMFLDEPPGPIGWIGIALVSVGAFVAQAASSERPRTLRG